MKAFALLALAGMSSLAFASESLETAVAQGTETEKYHYGMKLDVAKVISRSDTSTACGVVPAHITYEDHQGRVHRLEYMVFGEGCSNG
ncbi:DUF2790 domain-containing protein [Pseudomonas boanensis]|uniref:DUF2790 domain-containing protein n=1 Tax=Metapseudomonas boanensis TaxID=2822138 RepID=UPI0035D472EB